MLSNDPRNDLLNEFSTFLVSAVRDRGYTTTNEAGEIMHCPLDSALLSVVRAFLKDFPPDSMESGEEMKAFLKELPFVQAKRTPERRDKRATNATSS